jgi:hypothetical protein
MHITKRHGQELKSVDGQRLLVCIMHKRHDHQTGTITQT